MRRERFAKGVRSMRLVGQQTARRGLFEQPLGGLEITGLLAISAGLGLIGAMLSVQRHLARVR